jgi:hypothetical protein
MSQLKETFRIQKKESRPRSQAIKKLRNLGASCEQLTVTICGASDRIVKRKGEKIFKKGMRERESATCRFP